MEPHWVAGTARRRTSGRCWPERLFIRLLYRTLASDDEFV